MLSLKCLQGQIMWKDFKDLPAARAATRAVPENAMTRMSWKVASVLAAGLTTALNAPSRRHLLVGGGVPAKGIPCDVHGVGPARELDPAAVLLMEA